MELPVTSLTSHLPSQSEPLSLCFSVKQSIPVTVAADEVGQLQYLPIWREFWLDPEREQHRKSYVEESFLESYFIAIRCPENAQECAGLAKE